MNYAPAVSSNFVGVNSLVLVTGGAGFIGSHVVDTLVAAGNEVRVLDSLNPTAHSATPSYLNPGAEYLWGDVCDAATVRQAVDGVTHVCHQASMVGQGQGLCDIGSYVRHNDAGTATLLQALAEEGFAGRFVLASSMVVYGEGLYRCARHGLMRPGPREHSALARGQFDPVCPHCGGPLVAQPVSEDTAPQPRSIYAATKLHQEHLCACFARERRGASLVTLRYHNVYGPRMPRDTPYSGVAAIFRSSLAAKTAPTVFEDGQQLRDFIQVTDVARANLMALTAPDEGSATFNVATGKPRTVGDLARVLCDVAGENAPRPVTSSQFRLADIRHIFASAKRIQAELGFASRIQLEQGIGEFAAAPLRGEKQPGQTYKAQLTDAQLTSAA